jgi:hypothetical protein
MSEQPPMHKITSPSVTVGDLWLADGYEIVPIGENFEIRRRKQ